jgi:hypothetical protein
VGRKNVEIILVIHNFKRWSKTLLRKKRGKNKGTMVGGKENGKDNN